MPAALHFEITARDGAARRGLLRTRSGLVETPAFMPVATYGVVRGVSARDLVGPERRSCSPTPFICTSGPARRP